MSSDVLCHLRNAILFVFIVDKQRGKAAVKANNVFHFLCYDGYDVEAISDPYEKEAAKSFIENFGCIPKQLFPSPHPSRSNLEESFSPLYLEVCLLVCPLKIMVFLQLIFCFFFPYFSG